MTIPVYYNNNNNCLTDLMPRIIQETNLLKAKALLAYNCVLPKEKRNIGLAKEYKIPSITYQHGMFGCRDNERGIIDNVTGQGGLPVLSDYYWVWSQYDKDILLDAGCEESKIKITGCPVIWQHEYMYTNGQYAHKLGFYGNKIIKDPNTGLEWKFTAKEDSIPKYDGKGSLIVFMPNHSAHFRDRTESVYKQIKDIPNLFVKATDVHADWVDSPFKELDGEDRYRKIIFSSIHMHQNINIVHGLMKKTKVVIIDCPSTIQLICYAAGVHVVIPNYDWNITKDGKRIDNFTKADVVCDPDKVKEAVEDILSGKIDKTKEMAEMAEYYGSISVGNPTEKMLEYLQEL